MASDDNPVKGEITTTAEFICAVVAIFVIIAAHVVSDAMGAITTEDFAFGASYSSCRGEKEHNSLT